jgi:hypothetical protein
MQARAHAAAPSAPRAKVSRPRSRSPPTTSTRAVRSCRTPPPTEAISIARRDIPDAGVARVLTEPKAKRPPLPSSHEVARATLAGTPLHERLAFERFRVPSLSARAASAALAAVRAAKPDTYVDGKAVHLIVHRAGETSVNPHEAKANPAVVKWFRHLNVLEAAQKAVRRFVHKHQPSNAAEFERRHGKRGSLPRAMMLNSYSAGKLHGCVAHTDDIASDELHREVGMTHVVPANHHPTMMLKCAVRVVLVDERRTK